MGRESGAGSAAEGGRGVRGRAAVRAAITAAAVDLFLAHGYEATTIDDIASAARVGRRTFFRYFQSKDDAIFPDHQRVLATVEDLFGRADQSHQPIAAVCRAAEVVLDSYARQPELALKRFQLTDAVSSLRDKEITSTDEYQRSFARFLREHLDGADAPLRASVIAAAVVAAHNHVLRGWLKNGASGDVRTSMREALDYVRDVFSQRGAENPPEEDQVLVALVRTAAPLDTAMRRIEDSVQSLET